MTKGTQWQYRVDVSQRGLGARLLQEGEPIAYASKSLTDTETRYANIERELLAIVFACQQFNTYVLGRPFTVESDQKPLEMIHQKEPCKCPSQTPANAPSATVIQCDHQVPTREGNAACRCHCAGAPHELLGKSNWIWEFQLHCLQQGLDSQTQGCHQGRPHSWHSVPAYSAGWPHQRRHTARMVRAILGLQRPALYRWGTAVDGSQNSHSILPLWGDSTRAISQPPKSKQNAHQHLYWPGLDAGTIADYTRRCQECIHRSSASQRAIASSWCATGALGENCNGFTFYMNGRLYILICDYF